ncbi:MAG: hypothetical protein EB084_21985 [Proteobacteria bacterium]|nr:hypothetical protein [Pseudomonadota bacterium]
MNAQSPAPESPAAAPHDGFCLDTMTVADVGRGVGKALTIGAGMVGGLVGMIANGAAGGAHGIVHGANLREKQAEVGFQVAFAANLVAGGAFVYGTSAALGTLATGEQTWRTQSDAMRQQTCDTVDQYLTNALAQLPPAPQPTTARLVGQAAIGEVVGVAAGAMVGAQGGYVVGTRLGEKAVAWAGDKLAATFA